MTAPTAGKRLSEIQDSIRRHERQFKFYENCYRFVFLLGFLTGPAVVITLLSGIPDKYTVILPVTVSILIAVSFAGNWHNKALNHLNQAHKLTQLQIETESNPHASRPTLTDIK